jgi:hypothetical protein
MLHPTTQAIAESFGYVPFSEEDAPEQFQADITYILGETKRSPRSGDVRADKHGDEKDLEGWYEIPSNEDIEEWAFDSVCFTPGDDEVEPDHPDSWLRLLCLI